LARGIAVKLISPQFVAPFVKTNKNDRNDAEGIVEAASRPAMLPTTAPAKFIARNESPSRSSTRLARVHSKLVRLVRR